jgi:hypothetical protein
MTNKPSSKDQAFQLDLVARAAQSAGRPDLAEVARKEAQRFATKAIKEGKAGFVTDGKNAAIIER